MARVRRQAKTPNVLCEINVSSVMPIPEQAPGEIARLAKERLLSFRKQ
jgi:hypothetical protein